ncbi:helix-turn-helix domain-containing protein [Actinocatenispora sera]|uniref:TetR family transcriptional regulator n=1 Tax=Actinocatenispora sera TaxID=390989 RepID=A0A810L8V9_9ACTN|nr:TetR/AcrR family transcriptional regulator [Actinocatenispora sera]BCJ31974.1 TetR family transcriptional regulator [Actinocatenispora sera]
MTDTQRADARRNRDQLLAVARESFAEYGTATSLREVARRAGVGIGTLYRHFPTREALLEALLSDRFDTLRQDAADLAAEEDQRAALLRWLSRVAAGAGTYRGLPESVRTALRDHDSRLHDSCDAMRTAGGDLLRAAQRAGTVRTDATIEDLLAAATGIAWASENSADPAALTARLLDYLMHGLAVGER